MTLASQVLAAIEKLPAFSRDLIKSAVMLSFAR
jgi:hypothetical protein